MKEYKTIWLTGLVITALIIILPIALFVSGEETLSNDPWENMVPTPVHTGHAALMDGVYETGPDVTAACLECHDAAGHQVMDSVHFTWESEPVMLPGRDELVTVGKKNQINNLTKCFWTLAVTNAKSSLHVNRQHLVTAKFLI